MFHIKSVPEAKFYEEGVEGKVCPSLFSISAWGEGGARGGGGVQRFVKVRCHPSKADKVLLPLSVMR